MLKEIAGTSRLSSKNMMGNLTVIFILHMKK